jgi:hypothetical protein
MIRKSTQKRSVLSIAILAASILVTILAYGKAESKKDSNGILVFDEDATDDGATCVAIQTSNPNCHDTNTDGPNGSSSEGEASSSEEEGNTTADDVEY